jgi:hypothetical protein
MKWKKQAKEMSGGCTISACVFNKSPSIQFVFYNDDDAAMFLLSNSISPDYSSNKLLTKATEKGIKNDNSSNGSNSK